jgi:serine protease AprX
VITPPVAALPRPSLSLAAPHVLPCPLCGRPIDPAIFALRRTLEPRIARRLRAQRPDWKPDDGACPDCVAEAVQRAQQERSPASLHEEMLSPFPVYARDETDLLPTPARVHANPNFTGEGVTLAFLDSGFYPHLDLTRPRNRILIHVDATGPEPLEKPNFKQPRGSSWHGLMTTCVGAGNGFMSGRAFQGLAHKARLVLVRTGNRRGRGIRERDIQRALRWTIDNRERFDLRVVNISLGGDHPSTGKMTELDALVEEAADAGLAVIAAAGNGGMRRIVPPASAPSAITVGGLDDQNSLDRDRWRMYPSNYGAGVRGARKPDVIAPARWVAAPMLPRTWVHNEAQFLFQLHRSSDAELARFLRTGYAAKRFKQSTLRQPLDEVRRAIRQRLIEHKYVHPHYQHVDGTSMAAPTVSALAAQMLEANPRLSPAQVKKLILETAEPLDGAPKEQQGAGVIHAGRAVAAALRATGSRMQGWPLSPHLTRRTITFYYFDDEAREVALVGSFNGWQAAGHALQAHSPGAWQITLPRLASGTYGYKFLVDGARWVHDPENPARVEDGFGGFSSLLEL